MQSSTTAEILSAYRARETLNLSLWRTGDEQTQLKASLEVEVKELHDRSSALEQAALLHADEEERLLDDYVESAYEDLEVRYAFLPLSRAPENVYPRGLPACQALPLGCSARFLVRVALSLR
jgi:hypothetical protein